MAHRGATCRPRTAGGRPCVRVRRRWSRKGVVAKALEALALERDGESFLIDAAIMRAHQDASGAQKKEGPQQIGRSRGGPSTKLHAMVDALGNPVRLVLSPGQMHEM